MDMGPGEDSTIMDIRRHDQSSWSIMMRNEISKTIITV